MLKTETPSVAHTTLDQYPTDQLIHALVDDQFNAVHAVRAASEQLTRAVDAAAARLMEGGRLIYVGAGTSGRLGLLSTAWSCTPRSPGPGSGPSRCWPVVPQRFIKPLKAPRTTSSKAR